MFIVAGLASSGLTLERLGPADWVPVPQIVAGGMLVFLSYEGFELIANASDRIRQPERTLPWAYYGSVGVAIVLYVLLVAVTIGHLPFAAIAPHAELRAGGGGRSVHGQLRLQPAAVGAVLAAASAINADLFGASKLPVILAQEGQVPRRYAREVWHRYPAALALVAVWAVVITRLADLRAISAASSAGFLLVFAMVNLANAKLAAPDWQPALDRRPRRRRLSRGAGGHAGPAGRAAERRPRAVADRCGRRAAVRLPAGVPASRRRRRAHRPG